MNLRKTLAMLLLFCFVFTLLPLGAPALAADDPDDPEQQLITGTFGDGFEYEFDPVTGILTIRYTGTGDGNLRSFAAGEDAPWASFRDEIKELVIKNGVTTIGDGVFAACTNLKKVTFPATINKIAADAFSGCDNIQKVLSSGDAQSIYALAQIITSNEVTELEVKQYTETVNAAAQEYIVPQVQQAVANNTETGSGIIDTSGENHLTTETKDDVTITEGTISHPVYGELNYRREEVTNADGSKTAKETQTSPDGTYTHVSEERISADGKHVVHTAVSTNSYTDPDGNTHTNTQHHTTTTVYKDDGTGERTEIHDLGGMIIENYSQVNAEGNTTHTDSIQYSVTTDDNGDTQKVVTGYSTDDAIYDENGKIVAHEVHYYDADKNEVDPPAGPPSGPPTQGGDTPPQGGENQPGENQQSGDDNQSGDDPQTGGDNQGTDDPVTPPPTDGNDDPAGDPPTTGDNAAGGDDNSVPGNTQPSGDTPTTDNPPATGNDDPSGDQGTTPPANNTPDTNPPVETPEEGTDPLPESGTSSGE